MSKFLLTDVDQVHHERCQDECSIRSGDMLKCMNLQGKGSKPCSNIIHVVCAGYDSNIISHFTEYYCTDCTTSNTTLHQKPQEIESKARQATEPATTFQSQMVTSKEYNEMRLLAEKLQEQLRDKVEKLSQKEVEISQLQVTVSNLSQMRAERSRNVPEPVYPRTFHSTLVGQINDTLRLAEGVDDPMSAAHHSNPRHNPNNSTFNASNITTGWPNYVQQQRLADSYDDHRLTLLRSTVSKPDPFDGDVTRWPTFLSEFIRTSGRGSYRDYEDMDRLRELVKGEAKEMFRTELTDSCAEALTTLKRLDEFFGIRGNAVRVAFDRITQLPHVDKASDKQKIINLYTNAKEYALLCRIHNQHHELSAQGSIHMIESKMCVEHAKNWRQWTKTNHRLEDFDGIIAFLEEQIRELNSLEVRFKNNRSKAVVSANISTKEVTGGLNDGGTQNSTPNISSSSNESSDKRKKGSGKKKNRYASCECFLCRLKHPFYKCPELISYDQAKRIETINRLQICLRCLCSNKHKIEECPNKCLRCYITGCEIRNRHPLLHGHSNEQLPAFTTTSANSDTRFMQTVSDQADSSDDDSSSY